MKGFKDFVMRGNLVELAVAFVIGAAFATVVKAFTDVVLSLIGKVGGNPNFNTITPGGVPVGAFLTATVAFLVVAAVVYFFVVTRTRRRRPGSAGPRSTPPRMRMSSCSPRSVICWPAAHPSSPDLISLSRIRPHKTPGGP